MPQRESLAIVTAPGGEPVTLTELKAHLRVTETAEETLITEMGKAARRRLEQETGLALVSTVFDWTVDGWPELGPLYVPVGPLTAVASVKYYDTSNVLQTWASANYEADLPGRETLRYGRIAPVEGVTWPSFKQRLNAVVVRLTAGYPDDGGSPADYGANVPETLKVALKMMVEHWYDHRGEVAHAQTMQEVPLGVRALIGPYTLRRY